MHVLRVKGLGLDVQSDRLHITFNQPLTHEGAPPTQVEFWEHHEPKGMTDAGATFWQLATKLLRELDILGVTYHGSKAPTQATLRIAPDTSNTPPRIPPNMSNPGEEQLLNSYGDKYRLVQGINTLGAALSVLTGQWFGEITTDPKVMVDFDTATENYFWSERGERVVSECSFKLIGLLNSALGLAP